MSRRQFHKSAMPASRVTSWAYHEDLIELGECFYRDGAIHGDTKLLQHGCDLTGIYALRKPIPHAVDATARLVRAVVADRCLFSGGVDGANASPNPLSASTAAHAVAALYATAFAAFVTGYLDNQQTGAAKRSMYDVAATIGMPPSFVDRRHAIVHEGYAGLRELRRVACEALKWLWEDYWKVILGRSQRQERKGDENEEEIEIEPKMDSVAEGVLAEQIAAWALQKQEASSTRQTHSRTADKPLSATVVATTMVHTKGQRSVRRHCAVVLECLVQEETMLASTTGIKGEKHQIAKWDPLLRCLATQMRGTFTSALMNELFARLLRPNPIQEFHSLRGKGSKKQQNALSTHIKLPEDQASAILAWIRHLCNQPNWTRIIRRELTLNELARWPLENPGPYATIVAMTLVRSRLWTATRRHALNGHTAGSGLGSRSVSKVEIVDKLVEELTQERESATLEYEDGDDEEEIMHTEVDALIPHNDTASNSLEGMEIEH